MDDFERAGKSPSQVKAEAEAAKRARADDAAQKRNALAMAVAHVFGHEGVRSEDQRIVWNYLTREMWSRLETPDATTLAIFEGRRQKGVELAVLLDESKPRPV